MSTVTLANSSAKSKQLFSRVNRAVLPLESAAFQMNTFQEMVRARLRERTPNFSALATWLDSDPSTIQKRLKENGTALCLDWLDSVTSFYQMSVAEMVTMAGATWQEVKPLETQLLAYFREMTELQRRSLLTVMEHRGEATEKRRRARLGHPELTNEQQLLVDLYTQSDAQSREGVLKILRGTAKQQIGRSDRSPSDGKT